MRGISFDSAKPRVTRALALAGVALTLAVAAVPARADKPPWAGAPHSQHTDGGGSTGHKVGG
jgi:hypothetical protein